MNLVEKAEEIASTPGTLSRRRFVRRATRVSVAVVGALAGLGAFPSRGYAANYACCNLAFPNNWCQSDYVNHVCPCSASTYEWLCSWNHCTYTCGECYACNCSFAYPHWCTGFCPCSPELAEAAAKMDFTSRSRYLQHKDPGECHH
jgi:hypothetical protein